MRNLTIRAFKKTDEEFELEFDIPLSLSNQVKNILKTELIECLELSTQEIQQIEKIIGKQFYRTDYDFFIYF